MTNDEHDLERRARRPVDPSEREALVAELVASEPLVRREPSATVTESLRPHRHETMGAHETMFVELPDGIGVVRIRTGEKDVRSGYPRVSVEVVSDTVDTPAADGRFYEETYDPMASTVRLIGRPEGDMT